MGVVDLASVFDLLDLSRRGYITVEQVRRFLASVHIASLCDAQLSAALAQTCGTSAPARINKPHFIKVCIEHLVG